MATTTRRARPCRRALEARVRRELPHMADAEAADVARIVATLVRQFQPERVYVFGSQARGTPRANSDVDILVVVADAGEYPHHLTQSALGAIGFEVLAMDLMFMSRDEFAWRSTVVTSLPSTVLREGRPMNAA